MASAVADVLPKQLAEQLKYSADPKPTSVFPRVFKATEEALQERSARAAKDPDDEGAVNCFGSGCTAVVLLLQAR